ncbi:PREDICTED: oxysterol-binding protein 1-like isoform X1 [Branchiostoma belcheri]|uniref:Oxysterol-binding protein n=1 Tax=Branchiostoma belcheri TaxID=7741 RepID=A0A6P4Y3T3_BRABE|nr:PREDICTED: oxysterol-binding protein 1-like isoform X1 [Branchiostoma belcheri]
MPDSKQSAPSKGKAAPDEFKGWLFKWTNYLKGYQRRWFVLSNGLLSYYRTQAEMAHTCRGTINLAGAYIDVEDSCNFVISNGGTQCYHLKASSEVERQRWVTALELAKAKAIRLMESGASDDDEDGQSHTSPDKNEIQNTLRILSAKLEDLNTCNDLIAKHGAALQRSLSELEMLDKENSTDVQSKVKAVNERATLFRITSNAMINACADYLDLAQTQGRKWQKTLQYEREQRLRLEETVETLARQHNSLEQQVRAQASQGSLKTAPNDKAAADGKPESTAGSDDEDGEFFDAIDETPDSEFRTITIPDSHLTHRRTPSGVSAASMASEASEGAGKDFVYISSSDEEATDKPEEFGVKAKKKLERTASQHSVDSTSSSGGPRTPQTPSKVPKEPRRRRRTRIPEKPNISLNLWSIMKNCIGKELSKIPMPVNFNEPISMLQRLTEDFEYSDILNKAAQLESSTEQLAYVAAFTASAYSTTTQRTGKPFNPLLGETYELDLTEEFGWRAITEQVSHHPPAAAAYVDSKHGWESWQEFTMTSKFRGKYLNIIPQGIAHLKFTATGNHYTWRKVTSIVHNIIVGKLWIDQSGEMDIVNHKTGDKCHLVYTPYSYFSRETPRKVTGVVTDKDGQAHYVLSGTWDKKIEYAKIVKDQTGGNGRGKSVYQTTAPKVIWIRSNPPPWNTTMYNFTEMAMFLNEPEDQVAPTDSRNRPDQRAMENGHWNEANTLKVQLEEKQRAKRKQREAEAAQAAGEGKPYEGHKPVWFEKKLDPQTKNFIHMYKGNYWDCKTKGEFSQCPDIYL